MVVKFLFPLSRLVGVQVSVCGGIPALAYSQFLPAVLETALTVVFFIRHDPQVYDFGPQIPLILGGTTLLV